MNIYKKLIPVIFSLCLIYFLFVLSFYLVLYIDKDFLIKLFYKFNVFDNLSFLLSKSDIEKIAYELMDYLRGATSFLDTKVTINGTLTDLYSIKAKIHMADVRNIFLLNIKLHYFSLFVSIVMIYYANRFDISVKQISKVFKRTLIVILVLLVIIIIYAFIDFDSFFLLFHKLLFTNDYFLFDPTTDFIILMLPEQLFALIGVRFSIVFIFLNLFFVFLLHFLQKIPQSPEAK